MVVEDGKGRVQLSVGEIEQEMQMEKLNWQYSLISERPAAKNTPELVCGHKQEIVRKLPVAGKSIYSMASGSKRAFNHPSNKCQQQCAGTGIE